MNKRRVKPEHVRREEIVNAAYEVIFEVGLSNTTMAQIAKKAQLSVGIVSHYFGDKQGLINACMLEMLNVLRRKTAQYKAEVQDSHPESMIKAIIDSNFDISQVNQRAMRIWLDFWSASMHMPELSRLQRINDQRLYSNLKFHFLELMPKDQASIAARGLAALIDGLWLRGSLSQDTTFDSTLARSIAYDYVDTQLKLVKQIRQERQNE
ncbi:MULTISPECIES: transcriptional regulator BetI [Acinetobacter]|uniref:HTH-type transcriptional regulator BetI n=2 Tax=Acinetobacter baylyi TaxID=202950 RepID=Q6FDF7_ACIAD|nr:MULTISPECIES: transcriptional regulator BetI [Acinetobacter]ENV55516.1 transcriptional repressor BetI [Acinetobacter baylyi DSM 14961 = CIP 107474]KAF2370562.1 transcriptional regulator BetI [Acinetobacter baylyi]KAF2373804.1 transcriptional regulator BetI [Acinetobacter baylyi]KAF2377677.1 transcriptional regulator BetI [Acinetobacter baylyi]KAF2382234.1 transcriptional regulator BetI [Acinetobacter baylyi]